MAHHAGLAGAGGRLIVANRLIKPNSRVRSIVLEDCLSSLFALELLAPAPEYFLFSAYISDFEVMNNAFGQFRILLPEEVGKRVRLSTLLLALHERGAEVNILIRDEASNSDFYNRLAPHLPIKQAAHFHDKLFVCEHFFLHGSMNFTYTGATRSDETVEINTNPEDVNMALLQARELWKQTP
jgi:hypothetical protein